MIHKKKYNHLNPKVKRFFIARFVSLLYFLNGLMILSLAAKGISTVQAFKLVSFYSLLIVILEFPTGVIGDYFGHKNSVIAGQISFLIGLLIFILPINNIVLFYLVFFFFALGMSLISGSDIAWLHSISKNFKHDYANYITILIVSLFFATLIGGFILRFWGITVLILASLITCISGMILLVTVPYRFELGPRSSGNIFKSAKQGIIIVLQSRTLIGLFLLSGFIVALQSNIKYVLNYFATIPGYDIQIIGPIIAGVGILKVFGSQLSKKIKIIDEIKLLTLIILIFLLTLATMYFKYLPLLIYSVFGGVGVFLTVSITNKINQQVPNNIRASVLSLKSLVTRLITSGYVLLIGYVLDTYTFQILLWLKIAIIVFVAVVYKYLVKSNQMNIDN